MEASSHPNSIQALLKKGSWAFVAIPILIVYVRTMAPTVYGLDSAELTTGAYTLGITHAPGAPLYLLLANLFTHLPVGDVGYRVNLFSVFCAVLSILLFFRLMYHFTQRRMVSMLAAGWLGFSYYFWVSALAAELYAPAGCFFLLTIYGFVRWRQRGQAIDLCLASFVFGAGLGIHLMLVLALPGLVWMIRSRLLGQDPAPASNGWTPLQNILAATLCGLVGSGVYLYLPIRYLSGAELNYARDYWGVNLASLDGFWWMVTGRMFESFMFSTPLSQIPGQCWKYFYQLSSNFTPLGIVLGMSGFISQYKRSKTLAIAFMGMYLGHLFFYIPYNVQDKELMFLPSYILWGLWIGIGLDDAVMRLPKVNRLVSALLYGSVAAVVGLLLVMNYSLVDLSRDWSARQTGKDVIQRLEPGAWFYGTWSNVPILEYLQIVEKQRPDLTFRNLYFTGSAKAVSEARRQATRQIPIYTSDPNWFPSERIALVPSHSTDSKLYRVVFNLPEQVLGGKK